MNEARNYPGRVRERYRIMAKSDESNEEIVSTPISPSAYDQKPFDSDSSSKVSEENDFYIVVNSKSLLRNKEIFKILCKDNNFINHCNDKNISQEDQNLLGNNFNKYIKNYTKFTDEELAFVEKKKSLVADAKAMPKNISGWAQFKTTGLAGASAYWTSFLVAKLATNFISAGTGSSHAVWSSPFIAGTLNPLVSEPVANAFRSQGAHHASPDGKAYMDFDTAVQELRSAQNNNQPARIKECHTFITKIINECLEREKLMDSFLSTSFLKFFFMSSVEGIQDEDINELTQLCGKSGNIQKVINAAKWRAAITDELPFSFYVLAYIAPGFFSPIIKQSFSPFMAAFIDLVIHAAAGTLAGGLTGISQNYLRKWIQKSTLQNMSAEIKGAQLALAAAERDPWNEKLINLKKLLEVLAIDKDNFQSVLKQDNESNEPKELNKLIKELNIVIKGVQKEWEQARALHGEYDSWLSRTKNAVFASGKSYMGEVSNIDNPGLLEGAPAQASMCAKLIAVPLSLSLSCFHMALVIPALLNSGHTNATNVQGMNFTEFGDIGIEQPASLFEPTATISPGANAAYALAGVPLILGFITRYLFLHPYIQYWIRPIYGASGTVADSRKNDTVVNVQNTFAESEDDSENDEYEGSSYEESSSSPTTPRKINKSNTLNKQNKRSENYNEDGGSSEDSNSFESSRTRSSYV